MRIIDADDFISRLNHVPLVQEAIKKAMDCMPTIEERKKGKWILVREADENGNALYECSVCHMAETHVPIVEVSYCWNCGADMRGGNDGQKN